jgi:FMN reductase
VTPALATRARRSLEEIGVTFKVLVVVGNPKPASRTRDVAESVARRVVADVEGEVAVTTLELAELGPDLLGWGSERAADAVTSMLDADLLVVASPVFKATYTGLLKLLFDQISAGALDGRVVIPLMVGAGPHHAMAVDCHLRPLLVEVGGACPTAGLYVLDSTLDTLDVQIEAWAGAWSRLAIAAASARTPVATP